jgi:hypothetical protein
MTRLSSSLIVISLLVNCAIAAAETSESAAVPAKFDRERAFSDLAKQCDFGPRLPGTEAHRKTREYIKGILTAAGFAYGQQDFEAPSQLLGKTVAGVNLYGTYPKGAAVSYLLSAHYDTRPFADQDKTPDNKTQPLIGANDGGSGVAVLLELARQIPKLKLSHGVALVFFDLEDHGAPSDSEGFCQGSQYMAAHLPPELVFQYGVNLDMVGDSDLRLPYEMYSMKKAPELTTRLWDTGAQLYPSVFVKESGPPVYDDHMPFLLAGKHYVDVIDFQYPSWHTLGDSVDKCSPESLMAVGDTLLHFIQH